MVTSRSMCPAPSGPRGWLPTAPCGSAPLPCPSRGPSLWVNAPLSEKGESQVTLAYDGTKSLNFDLAWIAGEHAPHRLLIDNSLAPRTSTFVAHHFLNDF